MSRNDLALRTPDLEWAHRAANGEMEGLSWVAAEIHPDFKAWRQFEQDGERKFRHRSYSYWQPPSLVEASMDAQRAGVPTAWEALLVVFARTEWMMKTREYLWTPHSPQPLLLGTLVESFGIDASLHQRSPDILRRLTALLPTWHPYRGTVPRAREVLELCGMGDQLRNATTEQESGKIPKKVDLEGEVMACHVDQWWSLRRQAESASQLTIQGGLLRFQPADDAQKWVLRREDVLVEWSPGGSLPREALRLLPAWSVVRLARALPKAPKPSKASNANASRRNSKTEASSTAKNSALTESVRMSASGNAGGSTKTQPNKKKTS
ncbi:MAG: hypothetical protein ACJATT_000027 [Myxococcota bacterium]